MAGGFNNPLVSDGGGLAYPSIHSPNFVSGSIGWTINKDGSVEFNNGVFRGTVTAGSFIGANFEINQDGSFYYTGTPALGNLFFSITSNNGGTDRFGNVYQGPGAFYYSGSGDGGFIGITKTNTGQVVQYFGNTAHDGASHANAAFLELTVDELSIGWSGNGGQITMFAGNPGYCTIDSPMFSNAGTSAFPTFITTDTWHDTGGLANSWGKGTGFFKYKLLPGDGMVMVAAQGLNPGTVADGTVICVAANGLGAAWRPATAKAMVADTNQIKVNGVGTGAFENARLNFLPDGSITCSGFGTAATYCNCYGTFPLDI